MSRRMFSIVSVIALLALLLSTALAVVGCGSKTEKKAVEKEQPATPREETAETVPVEPGTTKPDGSEASQPTESETDSVTRVALESARANSAEMPELRVVDVKAAGDWASVVLEPVDQSADAATWLLKKVNGSWTVVDFGTALMPENYPEAPKELFQ